MRQAQIAEKNISPGNCRQPPFMPISPSEGGGRAGSRSYLRVEARFAAALWFSRNIDFMIRKMFCFMIKHFDNLNQLPSKPGKFIATS